MKQIVGHPHQVVETLFAANDAGKPPRQFAQFRGIPSPRLDLVLEKTLHLRRVGSARSVDQHVSQVVCNVTDRLGHAKY